MTENPTTPALEGGVPTEILAATWILVPAFNEGPIVRDVVGELTRRFPNVVVIDDGSSDETRRRSIEAGATSISHIVNLGQGAALRTGMEFALERGARFLVTFDADGQHREDDVEVLLAALLRPNVDVALGSRFLDRNSDMPRGRRLLLRGAVLFTRLVSGLRVTDAHNGLRAFSADAARQLRIDQPRMAHASEILHGIARRKLAYVEVPVRVTYTARSRRKGQAALDSINIVFDLFVRRFLR